MKKNTLFLGLLMAVIAINSNAQDSWVRKADFGGNARQDGTGLSIGDKGYIGLGYDGTTYGLKDFWEYDPVSNTWSQKADFAGDGRVLAVGFSIGNKGYIGTGEGPNFVQYKDFWEYDPAANTWTRKTDFGGQERAFSTGFSMGNKGYIGTGISRTCPGCDTYFSDFWEYDPVADTWTRKADFGGGGRSNPSSFSIGDKGYIGIGYLYGWRKDFWEYDPATNAWTRKADFGGSAREWAASFAIAAKGYIGTGYPSDSKDFWEYDPAINAWARKADFGGTGRSQAVGFSIADKGYIGTGNMSKDFWEYTPGTGCPVPTGLRVAKITDTSAVLRWTLSTEPVSGYKIRYRAVGSTELFKRNVKAGSNHAVLCGLIPNTTYEWQIRSNCAEDTSAWVYGPNFTTAAATFTSISGAANASAIKTNNVTIKVAPNPSNGNFTLQMKLPAMDAATTISVYNNLGEKVWQQSLGKLSGAVSRSIALPDKLQTGIYILKIERSDIELTQRIVVNK